MKNKFVRLSALALCLMMLFGGISAFAATPYLTYTYSIDGESMQSPEAYSPYMTITSSYMNLPEPLKNPRDLFVDKELKVYIADSGNSAVYVLDQYYKFDFKLDKFINEHGIHDSLNGCQGVFVNSENIYVADTENNRIVVFDREGNFEKVLNQPESDIFPEDSIYKPIALAVDESDRIYVVSSTTYMGVISMNGRGEFQAFIGAQKVSYNALDILWRQFQTAEQRALSQQNISTEYNNITIDDEGFIYVTTSSINESDQMSAIRDKSTSGTYAPVKKLNTAGNDVMNRNGFYPPSGEVNVSGAVFNEGEVGGASTIVDVALGEEETWSIIDQKRQKVFTYDNNGNLLFAFGDSGRQLGNLTNLSAIAYQGSKMLLLDRGDSTFTVYNRTEYGDLLLTALKNNNERNYDLAVKDWRSILQRNNNFDSAYIGIGKAFYRAGDWENAMKYFKIAYDTGNYSNAFKMYRQEWVSKYVIVIPIVVIIVAFLVIKFLRFANKVNAKTALTSGQRTFGQELLYGFHLIFHPFDGFWDLKHERRGSVRGAVFYVIVTVLAFTYQAVGRAYLFNPRSHFQSAFIQAVAVLVPLLLWTTANWCLTTLFEGEGSFKDIFVATSYSLLPLPMMVIPSVILTNFMTTSEAGIINMLVSFGWIWAGALIFCGMMITHDYSLFKSVLTGIGTIVGMAFIMFLVFLFSSLMARVASFITSIISEIALRM